MRQRNCVSGWGKDGGVRTLIMPLTLILLSGSSACSSHLTAPADDELLQGLFGTWWWIRSTGGISGATRTPDSEGHALTLTFTSPDQIEMFRDGVLEGGTTFEFVPATDDGSVIGSAQLLYAQALTGFDEQGVEITETGHLVLTDPCCDGFVFEWSRGP